MKAAWRDDVSFLINDLSSVVGNCSGWISSCLESSRRDGLGDLVKVTCESLWTLVALVASMLRVYISRPALLFVMFEVRMALYLR